MLGGGRSSSVGGTGWGVQYNISECSQVCAMLTFPELEVG